jgi:hypothetical protein
MLADTPTTRTVDTDKGPEERPMATSPTATSKRNGYRTLI